LITSATTNFLHHILHDSIPKPASHIENSFKLEQKLNGSKLENDYSLNSSDVIPLFTIIPLDLALKNVWISSILFHEHIVSPKMNFYMS